MPDDLAESHPVVATHRGNDELGSVEPRDGRTCPRPPLRENASHCSIFDIPEILLYLRLNEPVGGVTS